MFAGGMDLYDETLPVPRSARLPIELKTPDGFDPLDPATWPPAHGRLEYVGGRLLYMPPCGEEQALVVPQVARILLEWRERHPEFDIASNEAGMRLGEDSRGADAAIWPKPPAGTTRTRKFRTTPPLLAVEVAGGDEGDDEPALREKGSWYLDHGVKTVWIVLPATREIIVMRAGWEHRAGPGERLPEDPICPGLTPEVDSIFATL
jgi:Uma2 family endonuclease